MQGGGAQRRSGVRSLAPRGDASRRAASFRLPYPIVLVLAVSSSASCPASPDHARADVIFYWCLPVALPAAWVTSCAEFSFHFVSIALLAWIGRPHRGCIAFLAPFILPSSIGAPGSCSAGVSPPTEPATGSAPDGLPLAIVDVLEGREPGERRHRTVGLNSAFRISSPHAATPCTRCCASPAGRLGLAVGS